MDDAPLEQSVLEVPPEVPQEAVVEVPAEAVPPVADPVIEPGVSVPGSQPDRHPDEGAVLQPEVPLPVPATAAPSQDAVTLNAHVHQAARDIELAGEYIEEYLSNHPAAQFLKEIREVVSRLRDLV